MYDAADTLETCVFEGEGWEEEEEEDEVEAEAEAAAVCWQVTVVHLKRGAPLFLGTSINIVPNTSNKTGMKSLPRSLCCF